MVGRLSPLSLPSIIVPSSRPSRPLTCPRWRSPASCPAALPLSRPSRPLTCQAQVEQQVAPTVAQEEQQKDQGEEAAVPEVAASPPLPPPPPPVPANAAEEEEVPAEKRSLARLRGSVGWRSGIALFPFRCCATFASTNLGYRVTDVFDPHNLVSVLRYFAFLFSVDFGWLSCPVCFVHWWVGRLSRLQGKRVVIHSAGHEKLMLLNYWENTGAELLVRKSPASDWIDVFAKKACVFGHLSHQPSPHLAPPIRPPTPISPPTHQPIHPPLQP